MAEKEILDKLNEIQQQVALTNQSVKEGIFPVLKKHELCLHGEDGQSGVVVETKENTEKIKTLFSQIKEHIDNHWKFSSIIVAICGLLITVGVAFLKLMK